MLFLQTSRGAQRIKQTTLLTLKNKIKIMKTNQISTIQTERTHIEFTKFNKADYLRDFERNIYSKTTEEVRVIYKGYLEICKHFKKYTQHKYGCSKREQDMYELMSIIQDTLIDKARKDGLL